MEKNFALRVETFSTDIARESLNVADAAFEPTFTARLQRFVTEDAPAAGGRLLIPPTLAWALNSSFRPARS